MGRGDFLNDMITSVLMKQKAPEEVFTPREAKVNRAMYIERPDLETELKNALRSKMHIVIHGESGSGKSWLYKKVLGDLGVHMVGLNLANAARKKSIASELSSVLSKDNQYVQVGYKVKKVGGLDVVVAKSEMEHEQEFEANDRDVFEACCEAVRKAAGDGKRACLILDNLEAIITMPDLMDELANLIILLDDDRYARFDVRLVIVGVPAAVHDYYAKTPMKSTVSNRLSEMSEVGRLTDGQAMELLKKGFLSELQYAVEPDDFKELAAHAVYITDRIPQRLHEYCLQLAMNGEVVGRKLFKTMSLAADAKWVKTSLSACYTAIESLMNEKETKIGRRNQTMYVLGNSSLPEFRYSDAEELIREQFPRTTKDVTMDCSTLLTHLSSGETPILRKTTKGDSYQFVDPKYRMCIRAMLVKDPETETVSKIQINQI